VIEPRPLFAVGIGNSETKPEVVIFAILLLMDSVNHKLPSGPEVIPFGRLPIAIGNWANPGICAKPMLQLINKGTDMNNAPKLRDERKLFSTYLESQGVCGAWCGTL
jgi:hypothetical protein